ncbi:MAG: hypothetical protein ACK56Y_00730, partial [Pseudanabaena sp.]
LSKTYIAIESIFVKSISIQTSNSHYKHPFFESLPLAGFQKKDLDVSIAEGDGNIQILFIMRITA